MEKEKLKKEAVEKLKGKVLLIRDMEYEDGSLKRIHLEPAYHGLCPSQGLQVLEDGRIYGDVNVEDVPVTVSYTNYSEGLSVMAPKIETLKWEFSGRYTKNKVELTVRKDELDSENEAKEELKEFSEIIGRQQDNTEVDLANVTVKCYRKVSK